jgi:hypothetical protein
MISRAVSSATFIAIVVLVSPGCARQYRWYRSACECVPYDYCPEAPLPFTNYCGCPTPTAIRYQAKPAIADLFDPTVAPEENDGGPKLADGAPHDDLADPAEKASDGSIARPAP